MIASIYAAIISFFARYVSGGGMAVFVLLAALMAPQPLWAKPARIALVIGNADYHGSTLGPLKNPVNDATLVAASLKATGFQVRLLLNADQTTMKRGIQWLGRQLQQAGREATGLFYYAGHGFQVKGVNYMAPLGARLKRESDAAIEAVNMDWVLEQMEAAGNSMNIMLLDACRDTPLARSSRTGSRGLAMLRAPRSSFIGFATGPGKTASDGNGANSPYSRAIAREILRPGVPIEQVFKRVRLAVLKASKGQQIPWDHSSLTRDFYFVPGPDQSSSQQNSGQQLPDPAKTAAELQAGIALTQAAGISELEAFLKKQPKGILSDLARTRLAALKRKRTEQATPETAKIQALFARLSSRSVVKPNPKQPHEFYGNARIYEVQGDYLNARRSYLRFFRFKLPYVDPHYRFLTFLKVLEGRAGAREIYNELAARDRQDTTMQFMRLLLLNRLQRIRLLDHFIKQHPDFAPALYELSRDFSVDRLGSQSLSDKRREYSLLTRFLALAERGKFLRYFIDKRMAAKQLEDARRRLAALPKTIVAGNNAPVRMKASRNNSGWNLQFSLLEAAQEIQVALAGQPFKSTGYFAQVTDPRTGRPLPKSFISLPRNAPAQTIQVKYKDRRGQMQGPFALKFDPAMALIQNNINILKMTNNGWVSFGHRTKNSILAYFSHLVGYRCGIAKVEYGVDRQQPDRVFSLSECNRIDPFSVRTSDGRDSQTYIKLPASTRYVTVRLTFKDGTRSEITRFDVLR